MTQTPSEVLKFRWLDAMLPDVPFDGWTEVAAAKAAVRAGLGVAVLPRDFAPDDLAIDEGQRMPPLADAEAVLLTAADAGLAARRLADHLAHALEDEPARF